MDRTESLPTVPTADPPGAEPAPAPVPEETRADRWARPALLGLLAATALLYLWGLGASGWANAFYSAAVQAGSQNWTAFFYGSSDAANSITVDKTPASLWLMALSVRIFGLSSWSILVPQALLGVASVGVLYATVRRWHGPAAGLLAGTVLALTPVATLMFRFNNPDALLVFLLVAAAYATVRAVETASTRWIALTGVLVGFGFLTKMLQAFLVIPVFAGVYLLAAPTGLGRRIRQLLLAGLAVVVSAGWWVAVVELVPASARPYIGGSQNNSVLELTLGYNGLGRITGDEVGSVGGGGRPGGGGGGPFSGQAGLLRMFDTEVGGQISWLLPAALILLVAGMWLTGRASRTDRTRAGLLLWGGWLLVTGLIFSFMSGIFHAYYTVALAPAVGALVGIGVTALWRARAGAAALGPTAPARWRGFAATLVLAATLAVTAWWSWHLLGRTPDWHPWLRPTVLAVGLTAAVLLAAPAFLTGPHRAVPPSPASPPTPASPPSPPTPASPLIKEFVSGNGVRGDTNSLVNSGTETGPGTGTAAGHRAGFAGRIVRWVAPVVSVAGIVVALAGPAAYAMQTAATPHSGSIPSAGPAGAGGFGGPGGPGGRMPGGGNGQFPGGQNGAGQNGTGSNGTGPDGTGPDGGANAGGFPGFPGGGSA
ncbi:glycosyltransferase family 39 protein, partial [Micromonospora chalcea]|uniref:glycosyltransferase family 39 protein n=1 Tax=Micromonospora chalcea TaxID=1874 RepID=UPI0021A819E1